MNFQETDRARTTTSDRTMSHVAVSAYKKGSKSIETDSSNAKNNNYSNLTFSSTTKKTRVSSSSTLDLSQEEIKHFVPASLNVSS